MMDSNLSQHPDTRLHSGRGGGGRSREEGGRGGCCPSGLRMATGTDFGRVSHCPVPSLLEYSLWDGQNNAPPLRGPHPDPRNL